jgi:protoporphyrin/coproporphyrin ferrochelatase
MKRTGVLLINLGTPDEPTPKAVGRFLREFLMDEFVVDLPLPLRWLLVNVLIVPRRRKQSAALYQKIQTDRGSPLLMHTRDLTRAVATRLTSKDGAYVVEFGMRYGNPSIESALSKLQAAQVERILVLPLYPQYATSSFETAVVAAKAAAHELGIHDRLSILPPFYGDDGFIDSSAIRIHDHLKKYSPDHLVFSFHGVPVKHVTILDRSGGHCSVKPNCCESIGSANKDCYRAQCFATARAIAQRLGLDQDFYTIAFQSRFGRAEWIGPSTENVLGDLARKGVKDVAVVCPSFVADCLETLEEIAIRGRETFLHAGGRELKLIPALNTDSKWVETIINWIVKFDFS